ncbi:MAG: 2-oxoacid:acceptor oxidoreductase family protein [Desulfobacterales bacterium]|nr:2-oxoacid:acceptor oxidoreductase family protein [Desulfobacterales bacterium]
MTEIEAKRSQIVISGVGGQGVLFVTRILAEAAIRHRRPVLTSETHGMAQRGGTVISHLKVGDFASPLIRPGAADGMLVLKEENIAAHKGFLRPGGWMVVNAGGAVDAAGIFCEQLDADDVARKIGQPKAANVILLGFALARLDGSNVGLPCSRRDIEKCFESGSGGDGKKAANLAAALDAGFSQGVNG